eukprot:2812155-Amphidinium_carterae.1
MGKRQTERGTNGHSHGKNQIICQQGPCDIPFSNSLGISRVGGPDDIMLVLGGDFSLQNGCSVAFPTRVQKSIKAWYAHRNLFCEPEIQVQDRFSVAASLVQSSLFWSLRSSYPSVSLLQNINRRALRIARLTAKLRRQPGRSLEDFNRESAAILRNGHQTGLGECFSKATGEPIANC